jgi:hypothetical protein
MSHCFTLTKTQILQSLEEIFLATEDRAKATVHSDRESAFPYVEMETMSLRKREELVNMRDTLRIMTYYEKDMVKVNQELDQGVLEGLSESMLSDLSWRAKHVAASLNYWELVTPDFPRQLTSGRASEVDPLVSKFPILDVDEQALTKYPFYEPTQLVRYGFRAFHRSDGMQSHSSNTVCN